MVKNSSVPASRLSKNFNAIFYHQLRESQACGIITVQWFPGDNNLIGFLSKNKINGDLHYKFLQEMFYNFGIRWNTRV